MESVNTVNVPKMLSYDGMRQTVESNPFGERSSATNAFEQRRADLDVVTRGRVDRLYAQLINIYAKYGVSNIHEAYDKMEKRSIRITKKDAELMDRLVSAIKAALEGHDLTENDFKSLEINLLGILPWLYDFSKEAGEKNINEDDTVKRIEGQLNLDNLSERLLLDHNLCQKILQTLSRDVSPGAKRIETKDRLDMMGLLASIVYNKLMAKTDKSFGDQEIDLEGIGQVGHLGFRMDGGHLIIHGQAGDNLGFSMKGGSIRVNGGVGDGLGSGMEGGVIHVRTAGASVGWFMKGGRIEVQDGAARVAGSFRKGEIYAMGIRVK